MSNNKKRFGSTINRKEDSQYEVDNEITGKDQLFNSVPKAERKINIKYTDHLQGKWNMEEDQIYVKFILEHRNKLVSKTSRRSSRIFKQLAENLNFKRTPEQCRMHHQRMKKKARGRSIAAIAKFIQKKYQKMRFTQRNNIRFEQKFFEEMGKESEGKQIIYTQGSQQNQIKVEFEKVMEFKISIKLFLNDIQGW